MPTVVRLAAGLTLLIAAGLKAFTPDEMTFAQGAILIRFEVMFEGWLLSGWRGSQACRLSAIIFAGLGGVAAAQFVAGKPSCGCFGAAIVPPAVTIILDTFLATGLLCFLEAPPARFRGLPHLTSFANTNCVPVMNANGKPKSDTCYIEYDCIYDAETDACVKNTKVKPYTGTAFIYQTVNCPAPAPPAPPVDVN